MILAAIDIGSNAARLLIQDVKIDAFGTPIFTKLNLIRIPLRLGIDVFSDGMINAERELMLIQTMKVYEITMKIYKVEAYKAYATSAMRDAQNGDIIIEKVKKETNIDIQIISGSQEAEMVYETHITDLLNPDKSYLYIDVGGGSTELTLIENHKITYKESFNIGTIRLLHDGVTDEYWNNFKQKVKNATNDCNKLTAIGSGGNINKVFSLSKTKDDKPLSYNTLCSYLKNFEKLTVAERIATYKIKEDRADVIVPALKIFTSIMRWAHIEEIIVPKIGVADGIIHMLYNELTEHQPF